MSNCEEDDAAWAAYELADLPWDHGVACQLDAARDEPCRWLPDVNVIVKMQRIATLFFDWKTLTIIFKQYWSSELRVQPTNVHD